MASLLPNGKQTYWKVKPKLVYCHQRERMLLLQKLADYMPAAFVRPCVPRPKGFPYNNETRKRKHKKQDQLKKRRPRVQWMLQASKYVVQTVVPSEIRQEVGSDAIGRYWYNGCMEVWEKDIELPDGRVKPVTLAQLIAAWLNAGRDWRAARWHWLAQPQTNRRQELSAEDSAAIRARLQ